MTTSIATITRAELSAAFAAVMREWLTEWTLLLIDCRNGSESNPSICHSHDFCDANQAMLDAVARLLGIDDIDLQNCAVIALMDEAWDHRKAAGFSLMKGGAL